MAIRAAIPLCPTKEEAAEEGVVAAVPVADVLEPLDEGLEPEDVATGDVTVPVAEPDAGVVNEIDWAEALGPVTLRETIEESSVNQRSSKQ